MSVIDIHTHVFPDAVASRAVGSMIERAGLTSYYDGTVAGLLGAMDAANIDVSVLQPVATRPDQVTSINDWTASLASSRLVPFGGMHPDFPDPAAEIERMARLGLRGMKFHPEFQDFDPSDSQMRPIYKAATAHKMPILFHAGEDPNFETVRGIPLTFKRVAEEHPDLILILAHMGGYRVWEQVADHLVGSNVYLDTAYSFGHLSHEDFASIVRGHGPDRILFGSDGPWTDAAAELRMLGELDLPAEDLERILWRNAAELLDITV